jgi:three-Cys-motif partner protein
MQSDSDRRKWAYAEHTKAKHAILIRYMKAWLSILGRGARAAGHRAELVIVDAFAGRGRYTSEDRGSPLLLRDLAGQVVESRRADRVDLYYIESNPVNCANLTDELRLAEPPAGGTRARPLPKHF